MNPFRKLIASLDEKYEHNARYRAFREDLLFRTFVLSGIGAIFTAAFAIYNGIFAMLYNTLWYGVFSAYLMFLVLQRIIVIVTTRRISEKYDEEEKIKRAKLKIYLVNGVVFLPITIALTVIVALLITAQRPVVSNEILAITTAAYAFIKITVAIFNFIKANKSHDPVVQTIRNTCLVDALVSIILLESTLITTFGTLNRSMYALIGVSGLAASAFALALGSYMIVSATKKLKAD